MEERSREHPLIRSLARADSWWMCTSMWVGCGAPGAASPLSTVPMPVDICLGGRRKGVSGRALAGSQSVSKDFTPSGFVEVPGHGATSLSLSCEVFCRDSPALLVLWQLLSPLEPPPSPSSCCSPIPSPPRGLDQAVPWIPHLSKFFSQPVCAIEAPPEAFRLLGRTQVLGCQVSFCCRSCSTKGLGTPLNL